MKFYEAIDAMMQNKKVRHRFFQPDEWIRINNRGIYVFENGITIHPSLFWHTRTSDDWKNDWEIVEEIDSVVTEDNYKGIPIVGKSEFIKIAQKQNLENHYKEWLNLTKRGGSVLLGSSVKEFLKWLIDNDKIKVQ